MERKLQSVKAVEKAEREYQGILAEFSTENVRRFLKAETKDQRDLLVRVLRGSVENGMLYVDLISGQRLEINLTAQKLPLTGKHSLNDLHSRLERT